jgi:L-malate glycosyltransferase
MNILHVTTFLNGGAGKVLVDLAMSQADSGHQVCVIANKTEFEGYRHYKEHVERLSYSGIFFETCDSLFKRDPFLNKRASHELIEIFSDSKVFDVVHSHASLPAKICYEAFSESHTKPFYIQTMHGWGLNKTEQMEEDDVNTMNTLDSIVSLNQSGKKLLLSKGVKHSLLHVIPNGISCNLPRETKLSSDLTNFLGMRKWYMKFLCIGEVGERKNQIFLMRALNQLNQMGIVCSAVFIGPEQNVGYYAKCIKDNCVDGLCYWIGEVPNASSYMQHFDAVVLPSNSEGMPISIIEAFRAKVLVFGSRISEIEELLSEQRGYLFDIESTQEFVELVTSFDPSSVPDITQNAYKLYRNQYTLSVVADAYFELYQK